MITKKQITAIARKTRQYCHSEGIGQRVVVWRDGEADVAVSDNDIVARGRGDGWEYPLIRFRVPMRVADAESEIRRAERELAEAEAEDARMKANW